MPASRHAAPGGADGEASGTDAPADAPGGAPAVPSDLDLHTHTVRSDGLLQPRDLVRAAADAGVRLLAITDHDTLAGYREVAARPGAIPAGVELIPGVEINTIVRDHPSLWDNEIHVLGLGMDPSDDAFEAILASQRDGRRIRFERMVERLAAIGLDVRPALAEARAASTAPADPHDDALGRPTVARALIAIGAATTIDEAFRLYLMHGRPGYVSREGLGPIDAIRAIRAAGGLPVLAHFGEAPERLAVIRELVEAGLGGLEAHHLSFDPATAEAVGAVADAFGLLRTGGTDYHGDIGPYAQAHAGLAIPGSVAMAVRERLH